MITRILEMKNIDSFGKKFIFNEGITCLVGRNGAGKTFLMKQICKELKSKEIPYYFYDRFYESNKNTESILALIDPERLVELKNASEGMKTILNIRNKLNDNIGPFISEQINKKEKEVWLLFDSIDTGLSIDNVIALKELLQVVKKDCKDNNIVLFVVLAGNNYELAKNENCIDVVTGKRVKINSYTQFERINLA